MRFDVLGFAVGKVVPIGGLAAEEERKPADAVVRVGVGDENGDFAREVELPGAERGADAGVAAADDEDFCHITSRFVFRRRRLARRLGATSANASKLYQS